MRKSVLSLMWVAILWGCEEAPKSLAPAMEADPVESAGAAGDDSRTPVVARVNDGDGKTPCVPPASLDECGRCSNELIRHCRQDCLGEWGGSARLDMCGTCDSNPQNDCGMDCAGVWGGSAAQDRCGVCDDDPTNDCTVDCAGVWGGNATQDRCGVCDDDPTNDCTVDCLGVVAGDATVDHCGTCDDNPDNDCTMDCAGEWGGRATLDGCGTCDADPGNDCVQDCAGEWGGLATMDSCRVCDADPTNDCVQDCAGEWGGTATVDGCGTCDSNPRNDCVQDCAGVWGGQAMRDLCGFCDDDAGNDCGPFDFFVDAVQGDDSNEGTAQAPFKTLSFAVVAGAGSRIHVAPGQYTTDSGESFPIHITKGTQLVGDTAARGVGSTPTTIQGAGLAGKWSSANSQDVYAALVLGDGALLTGFEIAAPSDLGHAGASVVGENVLVDANTLRGYAGLHVAAATDPIIRSNTFHNASYGIYLYATNGSFSVVDNEWPSSTALPVDSRTSATGYVENNVIIGSGQVGVSANAGTIHVLGNHFLSDVGYTYGCLFASGTVTALFRDNACLTGERLGVQVKDGATASLGDAVMGGNNRFDGLATLVRIDNDSKVEAMGNDWNGQESPNCAVDISVSGGGTLLWGPNSGQQCN